ncbi:MAG: hypothetical protein J0L92_31155 [Deltaproteobacteria bacterium]|nr:hypothetical protein [Deltaproteobacteria bacterium]
MTRVAPIALLVLAGCGARTGLEVTSGIDASLPRDAGVDARLTVGLDATRSPDVLTPLDAFERPDVITPTDAFTEPDVLFVDAGDPCEIGPAPLAEPICTRPLFGREPTLSCPGGFVDVAAQGAGELAWECDAFRAEARFGARVYRGQRVRDQVALCIRTEFDYVDGCRWQTSQRLEGDASGDDLTLTYREVAISGDGDCFPPCTADSIVELR